MNVRSRPDTGSEPDIESTFSCHAEKRMLRLFMRRRWFHYKLHLPEQRSLGNNLLDLRRMLGRKLGLPAWAHALFPLPALSFTTTCQSNAMLPPLACITLLDLSYSCVLCRYSSMPKRYLRPNCSLRLPLACQPLKIKRLYQTLLLCQGLLQSTSSDAPPTLIP